MTNISVKIAGASATAKADGKLTSGMVGVGVTIEYDSTWNGLIKTASFRAGDFVRSRNNIGTTTTVPWEVMRRHGKSLEVGVEGRDTDGNIVIPTTWAIVGTIFPGANASIPGAATPDSGDTPIVGGAVIDDGVIAQDKTWSSKKISDEISNVSGGGVSETDYRHIYTYEHTAEEGAKQITITQDNDGNAFSCEDLIIFLTLPTNSDITTNYKTQLYIGTEMYKWLAYLPQGFSTSVTRRMRLHIYNFYENVWLTDGVYSDLNQVDHSIPNMNSTNSGFGNIRSNEVGVSAATKLAFMASSTFDAGTKIEIYGK